MISYKYTIKGGLKKMTIRLWQDDLDYLRRHYPDNYNAKIRGILSAWIKRNTEESEDDES